MTQLCVSLVDSKIVVGRFFSTTSWAVLVEPVYSLPDLLRCWRSLYVIPHELETDHDSGLR
jgi:hypothetical protein